MLHIFVHARVVQMTNMMSNMNSENLFFPESVTVPKAKASTGVFFPTVFLKFKYYTTRWHTFTIYSTYSSSSKGGLAAEALGKDLLSEEKHDM